MIVAIAVFVALALGVSAIGVVAVREYMECEDEMVKRFDEAS